MSCAGWNPTNLWKYKQFSYIIKMKQRNWIKLKNWGRKCIISKILVWKILLKSYLSLIYNDWNILLPIIFTSWKCKITFNTINWLHMYTDEYRQMQRERERERERDWCCNTLWFFTSYNHYDYTFYKHVLSVN